MSLADLAGKHSGDVYIIGTGESLDGFDFASMGDAPRIYIHRAAMGPFPTVPGKTYWLVRDYVWKTEQPGAWNETLARCVSGEMMGVFRKPMGTDKPGDTLIGPVANCVSFRGVRNVDVLDTRRTPDELYLGGGSGETAAHLAAVLGADKIIGVGFRSTNWSKHLRQYYGGRWGTHKTEKYETYYLSLLQTLNLLDIDFEIKEM